MKSLTAAVASRFAQTALRHVTREWPYKLDHVLAGPADVLPPRILHPIFYGSFDWHSCVHAHWLLARLYRRYPRLPEAAQIRDLFEDQLRPSKVAGEIAYLARSESRGFERPYGWAWALMLVGELALHASQEAQRWRAALAPLADAFRCRFEDYLPLATYPVRSGTHANTAFALLLALDYAEATHDARFNAICCEQARCWYGADADCQAWEPGGDDFLSPALIEAAAMRSVLCASAYAEWFAHFLPRAGTGEPAALFRPAMVSDRSDGKIAHLDGLNLSRAWCWRLIADAVDDIAVKQRAKTAIESHLFSALEQITGDYMGEHWLASFALLALDPYSGSNLRDTP